MIVPFAFTTFTLSCFFNEGAGYHSSPSIVPFAFTFWPPKASRLALWLCRLRSTLPSVAPVAFNLHLHLCQLIPLWKADPSSPVVQYAFNMSL